MSNTLSHNWVANSLDAHTVYFTTDVMPAGATLKVRVAGKGGPNLWLMVFDYHDGGASPSVHAFPIENVGQVLSFTLPRSLNVGLAVGYPSEGACAGAVDMGDYWQLSYNLLNFGTYTLDAAVEGQQTPFP